MGERVPAVFIPSSRSPPTLGAPTTSAPPIVPIVTHETILVVEDEPDILGLIKLNLEGAGYRVQTAGDGLQAMVRKQNMEATRVMIDHGVKILKVSDDQVEQFKSLSARALQKMRGENFSPRTLDELKSHLETYRQKKK